MLVFHTGLIVSPGFMGIYLPFHYTPAVIVILLVECLKK